MATEKLELPPGAIDVDGSVLEGGGQILRMVVGYAAILQKSVRISNIRASRSNPGLRPQHLCGINLVNDITRGFMAGNAVKSDCIVYIPGKIAPGEYVADTGTAGSCMLLIQISLPVMLMSGGAFKVEYRGGTNAEMAPQVDFSTEVFAPLMRKLFGVSLGLTLKRRGYFPKGGGAVEAATEPLVGALPAFTLVERGEVVRVRGFSISAGGAPKNVAARMVASATKALQAGLPESVEINIAAAHDDNVSGGGVSIVLVAETSTGCLFSGSALGERGVTAEKVGANAAEMLLRHLGQGGCVDEWMQDQLIIFMALAKGRSSMLTGPLSMHTKTAIHVTELMTSAKFTVTEAPEEGRHLVECEGIGYVFTETTPPAAAGAAAAGAAAAAVPWPLSNSAAPAPAGQAGSSNSGADQKAQ